MSKDLVNYYNVITEDGGVKSVDDLQKTTPYYPYLRMNDALEYAVRYNRKTKDTDENIKLLQKIKWQLEQVINWENKYNRIITSLFEVGNEATELYLSKMMIEYKIGEQQATLIEAIAKGNVDKAMDIVNKMLLEN